MLIICHTISDLNEVRLIQTQWGVLNQFSEMNHWFHVFCDAVVKGVHCSGLSGYHIPVTIPDSCWERDWLLVLTQ